MPEQNTLTKVDNNMITVLDDPAQFGGFKLNARFRDNGADEQVIVNLIELNSFTGDIRELIKFDSDDFESKTADSNEFKRAFADCIFEGEKPADASSFNQTLSALGIDFGFPSGRAYFDKAELVRNTAGGNPALSTIEITHDLARCGI